ncbi:hypothetical protein Ancab_011339 [Ancistrocladus abbreviatus]
MPKNGRWITWQSNPRVPCTLLGFAFLELEYGYFGNGEKRRSLHRNSLVYQLLLIQQQVGCYVMLICNGAADFTIPWARLIVKSDSKRAFHMVIDRGNAEVSFSCSFIVIGQLLRRHWQVHITHIIREANFCVDWLANAALRQSLGVTILQKMPSGMALLHSDDCQGVMKLYFVLQ